MKLAWILWLSQMLPQPAADSLCLSTTVYLEARDQTLRAGSKPSPKSPCDAATVACGATRSAPWSPLASSSPRPSWARTPA
jgi:hypothetical protein